MSSLLFSLLTWTWTDRITGDLQQGSSDEEGMMKVARQARIDKNFLEIHIKKYY